MQHEEDRISHYFAVVDFCREHCTIESVGQRVDRTKASLSIEDRGGG